MKNNKAMKKLVISLAIISYALLIFGIVYLISYDHWKEDFDPHALFMVLPLKHLLYLMVFFGVPIIVSVAVLQLPYSKRNHPLSKELIKIIEKPLGTGIFICYNISGLLFTAYVVFMFYKTVITVLILILALIVNIINFNPN